MRSLFAFVALLVAGCVTPVQSSGFSTLPAAPGPVPSAALGGEAVTVLAARQPAHAREVGVVEAHGRRPLATLEALVAELRRRTVELGGDCVRLDAFGTRYELVTETYTYDCGSTVTEMETRLRTTTDARGQMSSTTETVPVSRHVPKTCTGTREVEAGILTLTGRAMRTLSAETP